MSRRYAVEVGRCASCGIALVAKQTGEVREHQCWVQWSGEPIPWESIAARTAARRLRVDEGRLEGLVNRPGAALRGVKVVKIEDVGKPNAQSKLMVNAEDLAQLERRLVTFG